LRVPVARSPSTVATNAGEVGVAGGGLSAQHAEQREVVRSPSTRPRAL
jgi:hypothetical protein